MKFLGILSFVILLCMFIAPSREQRITTIQLDGVQYFVSRMNPYSPELNFFLAYQYCRSLGLQLASFETREKADSITQYLSNAGYTKYDFWTSGNKLGTDMFLWMSSGLPFNATFNYMKRPVDEDSAVLTDVVNSSTAPQRTARESSDSGSSNGCVALKAPNLEWATDDCTAIKDFICEQTRCYYYNYGSIPVSSAQGKPNTEKNTVKPSASTSSSPLSLSSSSASGSSSMDVAAFISKLRPETQSRLNSTKPAAEDNDPEISTNGPYDLYVQMHDDPSVNSHGYGETGNDEDSYVSTVVPDYVTTFKSVHDSHESVDSRL